MKKILFLAVFVTAIGGAFAFKTATVTNPGFYQSGASCVAGTTVQDNCSTANNGTQCTIDIPGTKPLALNNSDCTQPLKQP